ncbi:MAG: DoxX family membrane protein [Cyclobacteriaceae bacterium]
MLQHERTAYALSRLPIGFSFLGHGMVRLPKLSVFAEGMAQSFNETMLPSGLVLGFAYVLPFVELLLGIFLILGISMRKTTVVGITLICILIFGSSLQENWSSVATQMFYGLYFSLLYLFADYNSHSIINSQKNHGFTTNT